MTKCPKCGVWFDGRTMTKAEKKRQLKEMFVSGYVQAGVTHSTSGGGALEKEGEEAFESTYGDLPKRGTPTGNGEK